MIQSIGFTLRLITPLLLIDSGFVRLAHAEAVDEPEGSGLMRMRINERSAWNRVQASWSEEGALCWGEVCARGNLPMD